MKFSAPTLEATMVEHGYRSAGFGVEYIKEAVIQFYYIAICSVIQER